MANEILDSMETEGETAQLPSSKFTNYAFLLVLAAYVLPLFSGCAEKEPPPTLEQMLQGGWVRVDVLGFVKSKYRFNSGDLDVFSVLPNGLVQKHYFYTTEGDLLKWVDLVNEERAEFSVEFPTDTTAILSPEFGLKINLKRFEP